MNRSRLPRSLLGIEWLAPLLIVATALVVFAQGAAKEPDGVILSLLLGGLPTLGASVAASLLARRRRRAALTALAVALLLHVGLAVVSEGGGRWRDAAILIALVCSGLTFLVTTPVLIATAMLAVRRDEAAGDTLLGIGGRARARRSFCLRVALGRVPGLRMRYPVASDPLASLPVLFGPEVDAVSVIEKLSPAGELYRATTLAVPIARAPSVYAALASAGS